MKVQVFKIYGDNRKVFDTVSTPTLLHKSEHFPPDGKLNSDGTKILTKLDSAAAEYDMGSSVQDIVLDYAPPAFIADRSQYAAFSSEGTSTVRVCLDLTDESGIDCDAIQIGFFHGTTAEKIVFERKHSFTETNVPAGDYTERYNEDYTGPARAVFEEAEWNFIEPTTGDSFIRCTSPGRYTLSFDMHFAGDETEGPLSMLHEDLENGIYNTFDEFNAGNLFVRVWDLAGNESVFTGLKAFYLFPWTLDKFLDKLEPLILLFYDTYPADMFLPDNVIGTTSITVENRIRDLTNKYGLNIVLSLDADSLGYLVELNRKVEDGNLFQDVDGIDRVGYVRATAYLQSDLLDSNANKLIQAATLVKGSLGPWTKECTDNTRKINLDPFIPEFADGTKFKDFCKFLEQFLNTAWCPLDKDCKIGLLEKIARIGNFNDIDKIEYPALQYWAEDRGNELAFDRAATEAFKRFASIYHNLDATDFDNIRNLYRKLPLIDMYKGTQSCFRILFNSIGINAELIPLWRKKSDITHYEPEYYNGYDKDSKDSQNTRIDDSYVLSSHMELKIHGYVAADLLPIASSLVKLATSILPVVRTIEYLLIEELSVSTNYLTLGYTNVTKELPAEQNILQCISFLWNCSDITYKQRKDGSIDICLPQMCERCTTTGADWWKGYSPSTGIVDGYVSNGFVVTNRPTLNPGKFINMLDRTLKTHDLYSFLDFSTLSPAKTKLPATDWVASLVPVPNKRLRIVGTDWDSGVYILHTANDIAPVLSGLTTSEYMMLTFVFNRTTGLCYTTDYITASSKPDRLLPGYTVVDI